MQGVYPQHTHLPPSPPRFYPKAWGHPELRTAVAGYYNDNYDCEIDSENVMIFAGGKRSLLLRIHSFHIILTPPLSPPSPQAAPESTPF